MNPIIQIIKRWIARMLSASFMLLGAGIVAYNTFWWNDETPVGIAGDPAEP